MSYPMLIMQRASLISIIVYLDMIVNPAEYQYELWNDWGTRTERLIREFVYKGIRSYTPKSSKVHCYVSYKTTDHIRCWQSRYFKRGTRISGITNQINIGKYKNLNGATSVYSCYINSSNYWQHLLNSFWFEVMNCVTKLPAVTFSSNFRQISFFSLNVTDVTFLQLSLLTASIEFFLIWGHELRGKVTSGRVEL